MILYQVSRFDHEKLAKRYDQIVAQLRIVQHDKERLEQFQRQEVDGRFMEDLKRYVRLFMHCGGGGGGEEGMQ